MGRQQVEWRQKPRSGLKGREFIVVKNKGKPRDSNECNKQNIRVKHKRFGADGEL